MQVSELVLKLNRVDKNFLTANDFMLLVKFVGLFVAKSTQKLEIFAFLGGDLPVDPL